jgi:hypothetical protein
MHRTLSAVPVLATFVLLAACTSTASTSTPESGGPDETAPAEATVSAGCAAALADLETLPSDATFEEEDALILVGLSSCASVDEYLLAVHENPQSWLYDSESAVRDDLVLLSACGVAGAETTPVCVDAESQGLLS